MATTSSLFMYSLTLQPPSSITHAIVGQFAGTKEQLILTASGSRLTLLRPEPNANRVTTILSHDMFGIVRKIAAFRLAGSTKGRAIPRFSRLLLGSRQTYKNFIGPSLTNLVAGSELTIIDHIILSSDSGRITILEYIPSKNFFQRIHLETFGKSGIRRVIPGEYLVVDPKGRACLMASVEKNKLVYVLNRNAQAELTISSPLEAHKAQTLVFSMVALDVGYENPIFAALEIDYGESDQDPTGQAYADIEKQLVYYELDLGLNHVVRKWAETVDRTANVLFQVPGGTDGPSGVLVCGEETITYRHYNQDSHRIPIPRRKGATEDPQRKRHIVSGVMHKMKGAFFFLLQTEDGDLFRVTIDLLEDRHGRPTGEVEKINARYFDTVPVATNIIILKSGFLFVASESGNHHLYQFISLGDEGEYFSSENFPKELTETIPPMYFHPQPEGFIEINNAIDAMNPITACKVAQVAGEDAPNIYSTCGTGARSSFKTSKHGLEVLQNASDSLGNVPSAIWTVKANKNDELDKYIVLSFVNATLPLAIGSEIEEAVDTGFMTSVPTLAVQLFGEDSIIQVYPRGIRQVRRNGRTDDWYTPQHRTIVATSTNERQAVVALSSGELVYFELEEVDGSLAEYEEKKEMNGTVTCLSLGQVPEGRVRSAYLAVGCDDATVRILGLDPDALMDNKSVQALTAPPSALKILAMEDSSSGGSTLYLHIGLQSGVYLRTILDEITGDLSDTRTRFLGPRPVKLFEVDVEDQSAVLALSSRAWLGYCDVQTKSFMLDPLDYVPLEGGCNFSSISFQGMVGIHGQYLNVFAINLSSNLRKQSIPLAFTPRKFVKSPDYPLFYVIEADNNVLSSATQLRLQNDPNLVNGDAQTLPPETFGYPRGRGHWASCIQVIDPVTEKRVVHTLDLRDNEAAVSIAIANFASQDNEAFLIVGTAKDMIVAPRSHSGGFIHIYRIQDNGRTLEFIHKTKVEEPPLAICPFQGRMLVGIGTILRIYDLGMKQLLRKAQAEVVPNMIVDLQTQGSRIIASDISQSVIFIAYKFAENKLIPFADDALARWTTCASMVDYQTVCGGDKFGNLWMLRCPQVASDEADEEGATAHLLNERQYLHGAATRLSLVAHFYPNDIPVSVQKVQLVPGGQDVILWAGLQGTLGVLVPFISREDVDFFQSLEQHMRAEDPPLAGRDHLIYRSYYVPVKGIIDGDLCERYGTLSMDKKMHIAAELERSVRDVERKIGDIRTRAAY